MPQKIYEPTHEPPGVRGTKPPSRHAEDSEAMSLNDDRIGEILGRLASLEQRVQSLEDRPTALVPAEPHTTGELVPVPAFEERKVATLEKRLTEALGEIEDLRTELQSRPSFSGEHLENIRSGIHLRLHEVVRDEVTAVLSNWSAIVELRQELERVAREMAPSKHMEAISNVSKDVANLHESTAKALAVMEDCVKEVEVKMQRAADDMLATLHTEQATTLQAVHAAMEEAKASFHSNMKTRVDRFFRDSA